MKTKKVLQYKVIIEKGLDGYFVARVPALPGCATQAKTYEQLIVRIKEVIQLCHEVAEHDRGYRQQVSSLFKRPSFIGIEEVAVVV